jgi:hypothetical protein
VLAYVFWHRPSPETGAAEYEHALADFHRALAAAPPPGFQSSWAFRPAEVPWLGGPGYEDWYLVDGFTALGELNEAAVSASRKRPHDAVAALAVDGMGGVYRLVAGEPNPDATSAAWLSKPAGRTYPAFLAELGALGAAAWQRQMVLGPTPEFCLHDPTGVAGTSAPLVRVA